MTFIRPILVRMLAGYFRRTKIPDGLRELVGQNKNFTIITQGNSIVVAGLLRSFATRLGLNGEMNCKSRDYRSGLERMRRQAEDKAAPLHQLARDNSTLYWVSMHDEQIVEEIAKEHAAETPESSDLPTGLRTLNIFSGRGPTQNHPS